MNEAEADAFRRPWDEYEAPGIRILNWVSG
jgi:hypothetical protein